jgi:hypothetical protein
VSGQVGGNPFEQDVVDVLHPWDPSMSVRTVIAVAFGLAGRQASIGASGRGFHR